MTETLTPKEILALPMQNNDADAKTIGEYLIALLTEVWQEEEGFDGKRPFGNSGWKHEVYEALGTAGVIQVEWEEATDLGQRYYEGTSEDEKADKLVHDAIRSLLSE